MGARQSVTDDPPLLSRLVADRWELEFSSSTVSAKRRSTLPGRRDNAQDRRKAAEIIRLKEAGVRPTEIAVRLGIGWASVYRALGASVGEDRQEAA